MPPSNTSVAYIASALFWSTSIVSAPQSKAVAAALSHFPAVYQISFNARSTLTAEMIQPLSLLLQRNHSNTEAPHDRLHLQDIMTTSDVKQMVHKAPPYMSPYLVPSLLPSADNISFRDSSFFVREDAQLPTPAEVRRAAGTNYRAGRPPPVLFPSLNLLVKYGSAITVAEEQCLWAIGRFVPDVPVPEVYGWCRDNSETFIYMQLVGGITLEQSWPDLSVEERLDICKQLRHIVGNLRQLRQDPADQFIGEFL